MLTACRRTVREQMDALQQRRENQARVTQHAPGPGVVLVQPSCPLVVTPTQRKQLQQQIQQVNLDGFIHNTQERPLDNLLLRNLNTWEHNCILVYTI